MTTDTAQDHPTPPAGTHPERLDPETAERRVAEVSPEGAPADRRLGSGRLGHLLIAFASSVLVVGLVLALLLDLVAGIVLLLVGGITIVMNPEVWAALARRKERRRAGVRR